MLFSRIEFSEFIKSQYLTIARIINVVSSYIFLIFASNFFSNSLIGFSYIVISLLTVVSLFSTLGFDFLIIRFKKELKYKLRMPLFLVIPSIVAFLFSFFVSLIIINLNIGENLSPSFLSIISFLIFSTLFASSLTFGSILDAIGIANFKNHLVLIRSLISGFIQICAILLIINLQIVNSNIILFTYCLSFTLGIVSTLIFYLPKIQLNKLKYISIKKDFKNVLFGSQRVLRNYALINYISDLILKTPGYLFPLIVGETIGEESAAFFYIAWTIALFLSIISLSVSNNLVAKEREHKNSILKEDSKILVLTFLSLVLFSFILISFSKTILGIFGAEYIQVNSFFIILILSNLVLSFNHIIAALLRIKLKLKKLFILNSISSTFSILLGSFLLLYTMEMIFIGYSWLIANLISLIYGFFALRFLKKINSS